MHYVITLPKKQRKIMSSLSSLKVKKLVFTTFGETYIKRLEKATLLKDGEGFIANILLKRAYRQLLESEGSKIPQKPTNAIKSSSQQQLT